MRGFGILVEKKKFSVFSVAGQGMEIAEGAYTMKMNITEYTIDSPRVPGAFDGFTIAHVTDLHNRDFGNELVSRVAATCPDVIVITGDMIHKENQSAAAEKFAMGAVQIAPVYYVPGNHEKVLRGYPAFAHYLRDIGVRVLANEFAQIVRGEDSIAILGMNDPTFFEKGKTDFITELNRQCAMIAEQGIPYTVLLSHRPELFERYSEAGADLSLCGHTHGGHVRLPLIGAFYAPNQGLFPKYSDGKFEKNGKYMVISRGLGKSSWVPRMCNPPEVCVEKLRRTETKKEAAESN